MEKILNILEDCMNYRKYRYLWLNKLSKKMGRDMIRNLQHRNDMFMFLLSIRAGGVDLIFTAADAILFLEEIESILNFGFMGNRRSSSVRSN